MSEHLSPLDAMFLELEQADPSAHMQIGALMVFEPLPGGGTPTLASVRHHLMTRLDALPRYRQRLSSLRTGGLSWPTWEPVEDFHVAEHIHHVHLPAPGGDRELLAWASDYWSHRLDRGRPLWDAVLLDGLEGGRWALVTKTHHCLVDGIGSVDVGYLLLDSEPSPDGHRTHAVDVPPPPAPADEHAHAWLSPGILVKGVRAGAGAARHPRAVIERAAAMAEMLLRDELIAAPSSSLNQVMGTDRRFEIVRMSLDDLKAIKLALGGTINDVILALCTGGLRRLLIERGDDLPEQGLRGQIPVNIRTPEQRMALGNRLTSLFVHLPVAEEGPLGRYHRVLEEAESLKHGNQAAGSFGMIQLTSLAPPVLHTVLAQTLFDVRLFNLTITNVPGPQQTLYAFGAPMVEVLGLVPLFARHTIGIAIVSYDGSVVFGINGDRDTTEDMGALIAGIEEELADLRTLAGVQPRPARGHTSAQPPAPTSPAPPAAPAPSDAPAPPTTSAPSAPVIAMP